MIPSRVTSGTAGGDGFGGLLPDSMRRISPLSHSSAPSIFARWIICGFAAPVSRLVMVRSETFAFAASCF